MKPEVGQSYKWVKSGNTFSINEIRGNTVFVKYEKITEFITMSHSFLIYLIVSKKIFLL